jgi:hypothetical protein
MKILYWVKIMLTKVLIIGYLDVDGRADKANDKDHNQEILFEKFSELEDHTLETGAVVAVGNNEVFVVVEVAVAGYDVGDYDAFHRIVLDQDHPRSCCVVTSSSFGLHGLG